MKKVKFLLAAVAVVAVGAAVSATRAQVTDTVYTTTDPSAPCTVALNATLQFQGQPTVGIFRAAEKPGPCEVVTVYQRL